MMCCTGRRTQYQPHLLLYHRRLRTFVPVRLQHRGAQPMQTGLKHGFSLKPQRRNLRGLPLEFCNGGGSQKPEWFPYQTIKNVTTCPFV